MAQESQKSMQKQEEDKQAEEKRQEERMIRILSQDIEGSMRVYPGLTKIKGVSWSLSNAVCKKLSIDKNRKMGSLISDEVKKITEFIKTPALPGFILNRRNDFETGKNKHLTGTDLELRTDFDIKRLKKIRSYRGIRHGAGLPVRGQKTKSHFRKNRAKSTGIKKKTKKQT